MTFYLKPASLQISKLQEEAAKILDKNREYWRGKLAR